MDLTLLDIAWGSRQLLAFPIPNAEPDMEMLGLGHMLDGNVCGAVERL
jgi:hypothetical protein